jgi:alkylation response protein AidB-like acyl-CoA dehydrogenase
MVSIIPRRKSEVAQLTTVQTFEDLLTPDELSALMRSTWTWDDRALRRDLSALLVALDAAHAATARDETADHAETLLARALTSGAEFVANVLGPRLIGGTDDRLHERFIADAADPARFVRAASSAFARVRERAAHYVARQAEGVDYPVESSWLTLLSTNGQRGLASAMRAYGHDLCASGFFGTAALAWQTLRGVADSDHAAEYVKAIESESVSATVAAAEQSGSWDPALVRTKAVREVGDWRLSGVKLFVPAAGGADVILVVARSIAGPSLFAVERSAPRVRVAPLPVVDETRPLFAVELADTPAVLVSSEGDGGRLMLTTIDLATTALAAEQVGLIERSLNLLAAADSSAREVAEVTLHHAAALSLWRRALDEELAGSPGFSAAAAAAHIGCSGAAVEAATTAAVLGPSSETDAVLRRSLSGSLLFGGPALSHERLLERLGV